MEGAIGVIVIFPFDARFFENQDVDFLSNFL